MRRGLGFTLIELMVTIAVLAVIAMMAAPSFGNLVAEKKLDRDARDLALILSDARGQAAALRKNITVKFQNGVNTPTLYYWVPKSPDTTLNSDDGELYFSDLIFTPVGMPQYKTKQIDNPACNVVAPAQNPCDTKPEDYPKKITQILPLKFKLCNSKIKQSRVISLSLNGTIQQIEKGTC